MPVIVDETQAFLPGRGRRAGRRRRESRTLTTHFVLETVLRQSFGREREDLLVVAPAGAGATHAIRTALVDVPHLHVTGRASAARGAEEAAFAAGQHVVYDGHLSALGKVLIAERTARQAPPTGYVALPAAVSEVVRPTHPAAANSPILVVVPSFRGRPDVYAWAPHVEIYRFEPDHEEWLSQVRNWLQGQGDAGKEVLAYLEQRAADLVHLGFPEVQRALDLWSSGPVKTWQARIDELCNGCSPNEALMRRLLREPLLAHASDRAIVQAWVERGGCKRSWGYELLSKVRHRLGLASRTSRGGAAQPLAPSDAVR